MGWVIDVESYTATKTLEEVEKVLRSEELRRMIENGGAELWGPSRKEGGIFGYLVLARAKHTMTRAASFVADEVDEGTLLSFERRNFPKEELYQRFVDALRPPTKKRGPNIDTIPKVAKARLIKELKGKSQRVACELAGISPWTYRRWFRDPQTLAETERLRSDRTFQKEMEAI